MTSNVRCQRMTISKRKAEDDDAILGSMDDEAIDGEEFYRIGFGRGCRAWDAH